MNLEGRIALVTGGSRGIGRAVCEALAAEGAAVGVNYRSGRQQAEEVVSAIESAGGRAVAIQGDVADYDQVVADRRADGRRPRRTAHPRQQRRHRQRRSDLQHGSGHLARGHEGQLRRYLQLHEGLAVRVHASARGRDRERLVRDGRAWLDGRGELLGVEGRGECVHPLQRRGARTLRHPGKRRPSRASRRPRWWRG